MNKRMEEPRRSDKLVPASENHIAVFRGKEIRKIIYKGEWWFVINDVVATLTDSADPAQYFKRLKQRDPSLSDLMAKGGVQFVPPLILEVMTEGGPQKMYCWNTEGIFRLIQSMHRSGKSNMKSNFIVFYRIIPATRYDMMCRWEEQSWTQM